MQQNLNGQNSSITLCSIPIEILILNEMVLTTFEEDEKFLWMMFQFNLHNLLFIQKLIRWVLSYVVGLELVSPYLETWPEIMSQSVLTL